MLCGSQQACGPCFLKHWAPNPHMPRQHSGMATSAVSSCPQRFLSLLELLWSRFVRRQGASAKGAVVLQRVTVSACSGQEKLALPSDMGQVTMSQRGYQTGKQTGCQTGNLGAWHCGSGTGAAVPMLASQGSCRAPALTALQLMDPALAQLLCRGEDVEGPLVIDHLQDHTPQYHGQGSHGRQGELSLVATPSQPCRCLPAPHGAHGTDKEVKNKPPPPRLSTSFSDFQCAGGALGASRAGSWAGG